MIFRIFLKAGKRLLLQEYCCNSRFIILRKTTSLDNTQPYKHTQTTYSKGCKILPRLYCLLVLPGWLAEKVSTMLSLDTFWPHFLKRPYFIDFCTSKFIFSFWFISRVLNMISLINSVLNLCSAKDSGLKNVQNIEIKKTINNARRIYLTNKRRFYIP